MTHRQVAEAAIPESLPRLTRQAAVLENTLFLMWIEADMNGNERRASYLSSLRVKAVARLRRRWRAEL